MFCSKCGTENSETSKFCKGCGEKLQLSSPEPKNSKQIADEKNFESVNGDTAYFKMVVCCILCVSLLLVPFYNIFETEYREIVYKTPEKYKISDDEPELYDSSIVSIMKQLYYRIKITAHAKQETIDCLKDSQDEYYKQYQSGTIDNSLFNYYNSVYNTTISEIEQSEQHSLIIYLFVTMIIISAYIFVVGVISLYNMITNFNSAREYQSTFWKNVSSFAINMFIAMICFFIAIVAIPKFDFSTKNVCTPAWMYDESFWGFDLNLLFYFLAILSIAVKKYADYEIKRCHLYGMTRMQMNSIER